MTYRKVKNLKAENFKQLSGVNLKTFNQIIEIVKLAESLRKKSRRPSKVGIENQILMTLEYWREYRTYFPIGAAWGVNESTAHRIIRKIENILIQAKKLKLPGKKRLIQDNVPLKTVLIDVSETPIERPKKNRKDITVAKEKTHFESPNNCQSERRANTAYSLWEEKRA